MKVFCFAC